MPLLTYARGMSFAALSLMFLMGCAVASKNTQPVPEVRPGFLAGYLPKEGLPDSLALVPPPPAAGSEAFAADQQVHRSTRGLRDTPRWAFATKDAALSFPAAASVFSCAVGAAISEETTPRLYVLLRRTLMDGALATYAAKDHYQRRRPFVEFSERSCTPQDEPRLAQDGSYPSGHSALGWTWALVLTELAPERMNPILQRGYAFGQSRVICGVHWQTDVDAGRMIASAVMAKLHANQEFMASMRAASEEVRRAPAAHATQCAAEAAVLASKVPGVAP